MPRFQLTVLDQDRVVLTTQDILGPEKRQEIRDLFDEWKRTGGLLLMTGTETISRSTSIELDLGPSEAEVRHERLDEDPYEAWAESHGGGRTAVNPAAYRDL